MVSINDPLKFTQTLRKSLWDPHWFKFLRWVSIHSWCSCWLVRHPRPGYNEGSIGACPNPSWYHESDITGSPGHPDLTTPLRECRVWIGRQLGRSKFSTSTTWICVICLNSWGSGLQPASCLIFLLLLFHRLSPVTRPSTDTLWSRNPSSDWSQLQSGPTGSSGSPVQNPAGKKTISANKKLYQGAVSGVQTRWKQRVWSWHGSPTQKVSGRQSRAKSKVSSLSRLMSPGTPNKTFKKSSSCADLSQTRSIDKSDLELRSRWSRNHVVWKQKPTVHYSGFDQTFNCIWGVLWNNQTIYTFRGEVELWEGDSIWYSRAAIVGTVSWDCSASICHMIFTWRTTRDYVTRVLVTFPIASSTAQKPPWPSD